MTGYGHRRYAESLKEFGSPRQLSGCGGWLLMRPIGASGFQDAIGPYPLFCCQRWTELRADLDALETDGVAVALVADPFGDYSNDLLRRQFDVVSAYKRHHVIECQQPPAVSKHHRYYTRVAQRQIVVQRVGEPVQFAETWTRIYQCLVDRHRITGLRAFSPASFVEQLSTPGIIAFSAIHDNRVVGAHLWYVIGDVAYSHLAACDDDGYRLGAMYALYASAIDHFRSQVSWINLGGSAGHVDREDGLAAFKRGWTTQTRTVFLYGRILDPVRYRELVGERSPTGYFPAYRDVAY